MNNYTWEEQLLLEQFGKGHLTDSLRQLKEVVGYVEEPLMKETLKVLIRKLEQDLYDDFPQKGGRP